MLKRVLAVAAAVGVLAACEPPDTGDDPGGRDTTAVRAEITTLVHNYEAGLTGGDAAAIAGLFTEDGSAAFYGYPTTTGRAGIQEFYAGLFANARYAEVAIEPGPINVMSDRVATAGGTTMVIVEAGGARQQGWWRWAASYHRGEDGQLRLSYLIAFPDSTKAAP
jgi:uncharacterized protein (TIGR02246 family)